MKPEQFIRECGVKKAREVVEGHSKAYMPELFKYWSEELQNYVLAPKYASFLVEDLKRLVELLDIVGAIGTIEYTRSVVTNAPAAAIGYDTMHEGYFYENNKHYYENLRTFTINQIKEAVAVHESIYGGGDE